MVENRLKIALECCQACGVALTYGNVLGLSLLVGHVVPAQTLRPCIFFWQLLQNARPLRNYCSFFAVGFLLCSTFLFLLVGLPVCCPSVEVVGDALGLANFLLGIGLLLFIVPIITDTKFLRQWPDMVVFVELSAASVVVPFSTQIAVYVFQAAEVVRE